MSIRKKLAGIMVLGFALYFCTDYTIDRFVIISGSLELERREYERDLRACVATINREAYHLNLTNADWSSWDDMYEFAKTSSARAG